MPILPILMALQLAAAAPEGPGESVLVNKGAPLSVSFGCTEEDIAALGLTCPPEAPCEAYLELSAMEVVGARIFLAGNLHTTSVTLYSILLTSPDLGKTWTEPYERIRGGSLDQIQFLDFASGWAAGQLIQPLPRDAFLLKTTDGGATWRRHFVFGETRPGSVERFRFRSATEGELWIDRSRSGDPAARYERYESTTGGESWTLREAVRRPPPEEKEARASGWRLRADAATKAYHLERQAGDKWQPVASFLIPIGGCVASPPELREPPPAEPPATGAPSR